VLLGLPYSSEIDMWSLGCICVELFIGIPLFPGECEYNMLARIFEVLGPPPLEMIQACRHKDKYFIDTRFKTKEEFQLTTGVTLPNLKRYIEFSSLSQLVLEMIPYKKNAEDEVVKEKASREAFLDFLKGLLTIDPTQRWTPTQCMEHPFVSNSPYRAPYNPPPSKD
jgi:dual specificity protein kinase YAK1